MPDQYELRTQSAASALERGDQMASVAGVVFLADCIWGVIDIGFGVGKNVAPIMAIGMISGIIFLLGVSQMRNSNDL